MTRVSELAFRVAVAGDAFGDPCNPDDDGDGLTDADEITLYFTDPDNVDTDGDGLDDNDEVTEGTDPLYFDSDRDGCSDSQELGSNAVFGGLRDPTDFWDFFDTPEEVTNIRDGVVNILDILRVGSRFGNDMGNTAPINRDTHPLSPVPPLPAYYHPAYDRGPVIGPNHWNRAPADGVINIPDDILGIAAQFGHTC